MRLTSKKVHSCYDAYIIYIQSTTIAEPKKRAFIAVWSGLSLAAYRISRSCRTDRRTESLLSTARMNRLVWAFAVHLAQGLFPHFAPVEIRRTCISDLRHNHKVQTFIHSISTSEKPYELDLVKIIHALVAIDMFSLRGIGTSKFNPYIPSGHFCHNSLDRSNFKRRGVWLVFITTMFYRNSCI